MWLKAPLLFLRFPAVALATGTAGLVLALATASAPLFVAAGGDAALQLARRGVTADAAGVEIELHGVVDRRLVRRADAAVRAALGGGPLRPPQLYALSTRVDAHAHGRTTEVRLLSRPGFLDRVEVLERADGADGVWLPDSVARELRLGSGDHLAVTFGGDRGSAPVAGVYRDLRRVRFDRLPPYWQALAPLLVARETQGAEPPPPPLVLADVDAFLQLGRPLPPTLLRWEAPLRARPLTLAAAGRLAAAVQRTTTDVADEQTPLGAALGELSAYGAPRVRSQLAAVVATAEQAQSALQGPVRLSSLAGRLVALFVVAGAAAFTVQRRSGEYRLLVVAGEHPVATGLRAALEAVLPLAGGAAVGLLLAQRLVVSLGPPVGPASAAARGAALRGVAVALGLALVTVAVVTPLAARQLQSPGGRPGRRGSRRFVWEPVLVALAAATHYQLARRAAAVDAGSLDGLALVFPLLVVTAGTGLAVRGLRRVLPRLRRAGGRWPSAAYLAARQLAGASRPALLLVGATSVAVGVGTYAAVLSATTQRTVEAKAGVLVGGDVRVDDPPAAAIEAAAAFPTTVVHRQRATLTGRVEVDVLGVERDTFVRAVAWDRRYADVPLDELLAALGSDRDGRLPVLLVGGAVGDRATLEESRYAVPLEVVGRPRAFPGATGRRPLVVAAVDRYVTAVDAASGSSISAGLLFDQELWVRGPAREVLAALAAAGLEPTQVDPVPFVSAGPPRLPPVTTAESVARGPGWASVGWALGYLQALGLAAALLAAAGLLLYLQARQGEREVAYALARRMGLRRGAHGLAVALEVGGLLGAGAVVGAGLALLAAWLATGLLDPLPGIPPEPLRTLPGPPLLVVAACLPLLAVAGAVLVQRAADRAPVSEVLRLAR